MLALLVAVLLALAVAAEPPAADADTSEPTPPAVEEEAATAVVPGGSWGVPLGDARAGPVLAGTSLVLGTTGSVLLFYPDAEITTRLAGPSIVAISAPVLGTSVLCFGAAAVPEHRGDKLEGLAWMQTPRAPRSGTTARPHRDRPLLAGCPAPPGPVICSRARRYSTGSQKMKY